MPQNNFWFLSPYDRFFIYNLALHLESSNNNNDDATEPTATNGMYLLSRIFEIISCWKFNFSFIRNIVFFLPWIGYQNMKKCLHFTPYFFKSSLTFNLDKFIQSLYFTFSVKWCPFNLLTYDGLPPTKSSIMCCKLFIVNHL